MDIDTIRALLREGEYQLTEEFKDRLEQRDFSIEQAIAVVETGNVIEERADERPYPKCTVAAPMLRDVVDVLIPDELPVALAVGPRLLFITGYWRSDRPSRKRLRR